MNFKNILAEIEKADPEVYERLSGRRHILQSFGAKVAVAALPLAIGSMFKKAYGKTTSVVVDTLNFALELEYLEFNYYHVANNTGNLIPAADQPAFQTIEAHELQHINFLTSAITSLGGTPIPPKNYDPNANIPAYIPSGTYDFTAGGAFHVFEDYDTFLLVAQAFEDTGVRAYQGQYPQFMSSTYATVLQQAMEIGVTEARHAAHVRYIRRNLGSAAPDRPAPWITNNIAPSSAVQKNYNGEDNVLQNGLNITTITGVNGAISEASATAAFDEALDAATVQSLVKPFFLP